LVVLDHPRLALQLFNTSCVQVFSLFDPPWRDMLKFRPGPLVRRHTVSPKLIAGTFAAQKRWYIFDINQFG
jgi:hypothetical protein